MPPPSNRPPARWPIWAAMPDAQAANLPLVRQAQAALDHALLRTVLYHRACADGRHRRQGRPDPGRRSCECRHASVRADVEQRHVGGSQFQGNRSHLYAARAAARPSRWTPIHGSTFTGHVLSTSPGTGSSFSLLPPENSSGNWVKVVQRLPVRLSIDNNDAACRWPRA